jgi:acyl-CoA thioesterase II
VYSAVLLSADEPDLIRHADGIGDVAAPPDGGSAGEWDIAIVGEVDLSDPALVGPPDLDVWTRFSGAPPDGGVSQALLAFATDGFLIGTAMRPHEGVGQAQAHQTLSTGVISHTITFHEPFRASEWMLLRQHSSYAGRGRSYGRADVFSSDCRLVASFVQDAMIRAMGERAGAAL